MERVRIIIIWEIATWYYRADFYLANHPSPVLFQGDDVTRIARPAKIVERMVNQNTYDEYAQGMVYVFPWWDQLFKSSFV